MIVLRQLVFQANFFYLARLLLPPPYFALFNLAPPTPPLSFHLFRLYFYDSEHESLLGFQSSLGKEGSHPSRTNGRSI